MSELSAASWVAQDMTLTSGDAGRCLELPTTMTYSAHDPYCVCLTFHVGHMDVTWEVARSLLLRGLAGPAGEGDVKVRPGGWGAQGGETVILELTSPDGHLVVAASKRDVEMFLLRSYAVVPLGAESSYIDLDGVVEQLLA